VSAVGVALVLGACTVPGPEPAPAERPAPRPSGSILALAEDAGVPGLVRMAIGRQTVAPVGSMPPDPAAAAAAPDDRGGLTAVAVTRRGVARAYRIEGSAVRAVGPALSVADDPEHLSVSATAERVLVADCDRVRVMDLYGPNPRWTDVGTGCWASLSPDGTRIAWSPDGHRILGSDADGSRVRTMVDLGPRRLFGAPAWGAAGLAYATTVGDEAEIDVRHPDGTVERVVRERLEKTVRPPLLAWSREGDALAVMDDLGTGGALRVFDPSTRAERVIALDALGFEGLVWSPDGSSVATMTSSGALLVVGTDERWRARVDTTWTALLAWVG
jgi:hypothetical protein